MRLHGIANDGVDQILGNALFRQKQLHQLVAVHRQALEHLLPGSRGRLEQIGRNLFLADFFAVGAVEVISLHRDQVDHSLEIVLFADRPLHEDGIAAHLFADLLDDASVVGAGAIHFVDKRQTRHVIALHLPVNGQRLRLYAADSAQNEDRSVQHAETALDFNGEVDVAGRVDQVDHHVVPLNGGGGTGDRDPTFALEVHVVHRGAVAAAFDLVDSMDPASVKQDPLAEGGLARVDVCRNTDVSQFCQIHGNLKQPKKTCRGKKPAIRFAGPAPKAELPKAQFPAGPAPSGPSLDDAEPNEPKKPSQPLAGPTIENGVCPGGQAGG